MTVINRRPPESDIIDSHQGSSSGAMVEVASSRAAQEVQAAMIVAKRFPRDYIAAHRRIMESCKRTRLAEQAMYAYPRGGETVTGPSIRLAEELARQWGNLDFGIIELEQRHGESTVMAYCWDLETNTRQTKVFQVAHERHTRKGVTNLTDPRDIYELVANQGARRLRACILGIIPGDIVEEATEECEKTLTGKNDKPLMDRLKSMVAAYVALGVTQEMIEARLRHKLAATTEIEMVQLRKMYKSISDGMAKVDDFFQQPGDTAPVDAPGSTRTDQLARQIAGKSTDVQVDLNTSEKRETVSTQPAQESTQAQDAQKAPTTPEPEKAPAGGEPTREEQLIQTMVDVYGCTSEQARKSLDAVSIKDLNRPLSVNANKDVPFSHLMAQVKAKKVPLLTN
jgi:hypothetical protein